VVTLQARIFAAEPAERQPVAIDELLRQDPRNVQNAGLFAPDGQRITGNLAQIPSDLRIDGPAQQSFVPVGPGGAGREAVRAVGRRLSDGKVLVIGRNVDEAAAITGIVGKALALGLIPAFCLSIVAGILLSIRAQRRVEEVTRRVERIVAGDLRQRMPTHGGTDSFDKLAAIVNGMLDKIEALVHEIAGVGDDIAHDLRTPLTRVRVNLQRGRANSRTLEDSQAVFDKAIRGLDQSLAIITAILRIAEIEHNRRLAGFGSVALVALIREVGDLYEPIAEEKGIVLQIHVEHEALVRGDRDLLFEAVANLVDNAIKFTPRGGRVWVALIDGGVECVVRVSDTGPGISEEERDVVTRRFYRSDRSRQTQGVGLGLSLVAAILNLHGFRLTIAPGPGCVVEFTCPVCEAA
jgi:signal transduction histidine kinase